MDGTFQSNGVGRVLCIKEFTISNFSASVLSVLQKCIVIPFFFSSAELLENVIVVLLKSYKRLCSVVQPSPNECKVVVNCMERLSSLFTGSTPWRLASCFIRDLVNSQNTAGGTIAANGKIYTSSGAWNGLNYLSYAPSVCYPVLKHLLSVLQNDFSGNVQANVLIRLWAKSI